MSFVTVDYIFLCAILLCVVISTIRGFVSELFGKASWIVGLIAAFIFYDDVAKLFTGIQSLTLKVVLGFSITFLVVFIMIKLLEIIFSKFVENEIMSSLNRALGFLLGIGEGIALVSLAIHVINWQDIFDKTFLNGSFFVHLLG